MSWKADRLHDCDKVAGYSLVVDDTYPTMWRVKRPDKSLSSIVLGPKMPPWPYWTGT